MSSVPDILVVDSNNRNTEILAEFLGKVGYHIDGTASLEELDGVLQKRVLNFRLALVDLTGFDETIWARCDRLNERGIPWLAVCATSQQLAAQQEGLKHKARSILVKPVAIDDLVLTIRSVLEGGA